MGQLETLLFETERRVISFKSGTTMPDNSQLGFNANPNTAVSGATDGQTLIYNCPVGTRYQEDDGTQWYKKTMPNVWKRFGEEYAQTASSTATETISLAHSIAVMSESIADRTESLARDVQKTELKNYSIASSTSNRIGKIVYMTSSQDTVGLAKATLESTMPAFGIIMHDSDTSVKVKSLQTLYRNVKVDSNATIISGDKVFISNIEAGKVTNNPPETSGVCQMVGISDQAQSSANIDLQFSPTNIIVL